MATSRIVNSDDFELLDPPGQSVRLRFRGVLGGSSVTWQAEFMTLSAAGARRNFIEVGGPVSGGRCLRVALDVPEMDLPSVRKTVVMVRNWKRLAPGRHEFGD